MLKLLSCVAIIISVVSGCNGRSVKNQAPLVVSPDELSNHYQSHINEIWDLVNYTNDALNKYCGIQLIIKDSTVSELYVYDFIWMGTKNPVQKDFDNLLHLIGFTNETIDTIVEKLNAAGCLSIEMMKDSGYIKVLYKADKKCGYYYRLFRKELSEDDIKEVINSSTICIPYTNKVMFEYNPYKKNADPTFPGREEYLQKYFSYCLPNDIAPQ